MDPRLGFMLCAIPTAIIELSLIAFLIVNRKRFIMSVTAPSAAALAIIAGLTASNDKLAQANTDLAKALAAGGGDDGQAAFDLSAISEAAAPLNDSAAILATAIADAAAKAGGGTPPDALAITTTSLPDGTVGAAYNGQIQIIGGVDPVAFSASGLPDGLGMDPTNGDITGTVATAGVFSVSVTATDSSTPSPVKVSASLSLTFA